MVGSPNNPNPITKPAGAALLGKRASLEAQVKDGREILEVSGHLKLTKTALGFTQAYLFRDLALEKQVTEEMESRVGIATVLNRYRAQDPGAPELQWPQHFPVRILAGEGAITSGHNVFLFWPGAEGRTANGLSEVRAFEFVDIWKSIFEQVVFPCAERVFDAHSFDAFVSLRMNLERTIFQAGLLHELGHQVGPWNCLPVIRHDLKLSPRNLDALTELQSDCLLGSLLPEFQSLSLFVVLSRLFWFGRRGYRANATSALLNEDGDAWTGSFLWKRFRELEVIVPAGGGKYTLHTELLAKALGVVLEELTLLGQTVSSSPLEESLRVTEWISQSIPSKQGIGFILSEELVGIFAACEDIVETIHFVPPYAVKDFKQTYLKTKP